MIALFSDSISKMVRFHSPRVIELIKQRDQLNEKLAHEADEAYTSFVQGFVRNYMVLRNVVVSLATLDAVKSLARLASLPGYCKPKMVMPTSTLPSTVSLTAFRHPISEVTTTDLYVPNDLSLGASGAKGILLTGSNMGGKSSTVRAVALCVILAQLGAYVPAESATLSLHDAVLTRVGASDEIARSRSTFRVEVEETAEILRACTGRSLVILDELGRGTSTNDGTAVAYAVLHHLMTRSIQARPSLLFITHYFTLGTVAARPELHGRLKNMHMAYSEQVDPAIGRKQVVFLYQLRNGMASSSFGVHCAALAGMPEELLEVAARKAKALEEETEKRRKVRRVRQLARITKIIFTFEDSPDEALQALRETA